MKDKAALLFFDFNKAVINLQYGIQEAKDDLDIDGTIKRFELCYELAWKLIKEHLAADGIICRNPRDCFKAAKSNQLIDDEMNWLKMIEDRNYLVHCYTFEQSRSIFDQVKAIHADSLNFLRRKLNPVYKT